MKRAIAFGLALVLSFSCSGCAYTAHDRDNTAVFYYRRDEFTYDSDQDVVVAEQRDISSGREDLSYLLSLYMMGPLEEQLDSPFPAGTKLEQIQRIDKTVYLTLTDMDSNVTDSGFTIAAACLAMTVFDLTGCRYVSITSGQRSIVLESSDLLFYDTVLPNTQTTEDAQ